MTALFTPGIECLTNVAIIAPREEPSGNRHPDCERLLTRSDDGDIEDDPKQDSFIAAVDDETINENWTGFRGKPIQWVN